MPAYADQVASIGEGEFVVPSDGAGPTLVACLTTAMHTWRMIPVQDGVDEFSITFAR